MLYDIRYMICNFLFIFWIVFYFFDVFRCLKCVVMRVFVGVLFRWFLGMKLYNMDIFLNIGFKNVFFNIRFFKRVIFLFLVIILFYFED